MAIKTRINTKTKAAKAAQEIGGVTLADLVKARKGNTKVLTKLHRIWREGKLAEVTMPLIQEAIATQVKSERDWNQFVSTYIKDGSQAYLQIEGAKNDASFANMRFVHGTNELNEKFKGQVAFERDRHKFAIDYNRAKMFCDLLTQQVESDARLFEQGARIKTKQLDEDMAYEIKEIETISKYGSDGLRLIEKKDYSTDSKGGLSRTLLKIRNALGI